MAVKKTTEPIKRLKQMHKNAANGPAGGGGWPVHAGTV